MRIVVLGFALGVCTLVVTPVGAFAPARHRVDCPLVTSRSRLPACALRVPPPAASLATTSGWAIAAATGATTLGAQLILTRTYKRSNDVHVRARAPAFFAYNAIACALMCAASLVGLVAFCQPSGVPATAVARVLAPTEASRILCAAIFGELICWDLPCTLAIKRLRRPDMILHHTVSLLPVPACTRHDLERGRGVCNAKLPLLLVHAGNGRGVCVHFHLGGAHVLGALLLWRIRALDGTTRAQ
jgi:hypothetical protein